MIKYETTDANADAYSDLVMDMGGFTVVKEVPIDEFGHTQSELFLEVTNNHCYRPGYVEQYGERNGQVFFVDDLNEDMILLYSKKLKKEKVLELVGNVFK